MNAVADEFSVQIVVGENGAENSRLAMIEGAHGIERVGRTDGSCGDCRLSFGGGGV